MLSKEELMVSLHADAKAVAVIPMALKGQVIGVVSLGERRDWERSPLDDAKVSLCQALVNEMVMAIEHARLYQETVQRAAQIARAERHLTSVVESANDLIVSLDSEGEIATWNQTARRICGLMPEEVIGRRLASLCAKEHRADMEAMVELAARGERVTDREMNLLDRAGRRIPIAWSCSPMHDEAGQAMGIVAVGRDLTERRRLEAQLIQSAKMASLGVMAGGIAHEIRNPLAVSSAAVQLLLESPDDQELREECAAKIYSGITRAAVIVENLLKFAHPSEAHRAPVDIHQALKEALSLVRYQLVRSRISLEKDLNSQLPSVIGNRNLLQQVFSNLILNACNAMPDGGRLVVQTDLNAAGEVEIRFIDTGCGIPRENLSHIFDPFFTTMPVGKGTGLGLSICYAIVEQHQGQIDVRSELGVGSTFVVRLPAIEQASE
jgi:PAS domain S-box-containing protein